MVEYGIVKFFDERDGKKFGFLQPCDVDSTVNGKKDVFFHFNDRAKAGIHSGELVFTPAADQAFLYPQKGALIVFERKAARRGDKASPWTWGQAWQETELRLISGNLSNEDLPRRDWDDLAWCHSCNRDTGFCDCICYVCYEDLADCQCLCAACGVKLPGGSLCHKDLESWNEAVQGPKPNEAIHIGTCVSCGLRFNKEFEIEEQYAGYGKAIRALRPHNRTTCLKCPAPKLLQLKDGYKVYDLGNGNALIENFVTRVTVPLDDYRRDARPLHWVRELATS